MADLKDVIDKLTNEGELVRNRGTHSIRSVKELLLSNQETPAQKKQDREDTRNFQKSLLAKMAGSAGAGAGITPGAKDKKIGGMFAGIAGAIGGLGKGVGKGVGGFMKGIGTGVAGAAKFAIAFPLFGVGIAGFAVAIGAATWAISKMMPSIADGLQKFKEVDGKNLISVGLGMTSLGAGFAAMGAGGAIAGVGNLIGGIADGVAGLFGAKSGEEALMEKLKKFSKVKLDATNIKGNAEAMVAYGVAMTAAGAGSMLGSLATLTDGAIGGLGKLFGGVPVVDQLIAFSKHDIDGAKVKKNADAMVSYAGAMAVGAGATALKAIGGLGNLLGTALDGISKIFGGEGVLDTQISDMKKISAAEGIDSTKILNFAGALIAYTGAMTVGAAGAGLKAVGSLGNVISTGLDGISKFFGGKDSGVLDTQISDLKKISAAEGIDVEKIKNVATAMLEYAVAMTGGAGGSSMKAVASVANLFSTIFGGLTSLLGGKSTLDNQLGDLKKITLASDGIDTVKIKNVASAMSVYATAMASSAKAAGSTAFADIATFIGGVTKSLGAFLGVKESDPIGDLKKFAANSVTEAEVSQIKSNTKGLQAYAEATAIIANLKIGTGFGDAIGNLLSGIGSWFSGDDKSDPLDAFEKFAGKKFDAKQAGENVKAMTAFSQFKYNKKDAGWRDFASDLALTVPVIEAAVAGSEKVKWLRTNLKFKGLASPDIDFETAKNNINKLKTALNINGESSDLKPSAEGSSLKDSIDLLTAQIAAMPVGGNTFNRGGDQHTSTGQGAPLIPKQTVANGTSGFM